MNKRRSQVSWTFEEEVTLARKETLGRSKPNTWMSQRKINPPDEAYSLRVVSYLLGRDEIGGRETVSAKVGREMTPLTQKYARCHNTDNTHQMIFNCVLSP